MLLDALLTLNVTRCTATVHTSAKAHLMSVTIWIWTRIPDPDRHKNLIIFICSLPNVSENLTQIRLEVSAQSY